VAIDHIAVGADEGQLTRGTLRVDSEADQVHVLHRAHTCAEPQPWRQSHCPLAEGAVGVVQEK